jgi:peroxiredoxin
VLDLRALQLALDRVEALGATLVAVSPETRESVSETCEKNKFTFEIFSDPGNRVARRFGLVFQLPVDLRPVYAGFGIDLAKANGAETYELPIPATYILGTAGKIVKALIDPDYTRRLDTEDILAALQQIK